MQNTISMLHPIISIVTGAVSAPFFSRQTQFIKGINHVLDIQRDTLEVLKNQQLIFIIINPQNSKDKEKALEIKSMVTENPGMIVIMMEENSEFNHPTFHTPLQTFEELKSNMNGLIAVDEISPSNANLLHYLIFIKTISEFIYKDGLFRHDNFELIYTIFENAGISSLGYANTKGQGAKVATASAVLQLLVEDRQTLYTAKSIFLNIVSGKDSVLDESEVEQIRHLIRQLTSDSADIFISVSNAAEIDEDVIHVSILCTASKP